MLSRDRREQHLESKRQAAPQRYSPCTAERLAATQPVTAASPLSLKEGRTLRAGHEGSPSPPTILHHRVCPRLPVFLAQTRVKGK